MRSAMQDTMSERVAIVTAASQGMGAACARELVQRGYRVALMARSESVVGFAASLGGVGVVGSVTQENDLRRLVDITMERYGRVDAVVNNTGHPANGDLLMISDDEWRNGVDLLLLNVVRMARLVTPVMREQGGGAFVNISSFGAVEPSLQYPVSSTVRAALSAFVRLYAEKYAVNNIRMNSVLPGFIDSYEIGDAVRARVPMNRAGTVAEVARTVAFLLSADAGYITGQQIRIDGGLVKTI